MQGFIDAIAEQRLLRIVHAVRIHRVLAAVRQKSPDVERVGHEAAVLPVDQINAFAVVDAVDRHKIAVRKRERHFLHAVEKQRVRAVQQRFALKAGESFGAVCDLLFGNGSVVIGSGRKRVHDLCDGSRGAGDAAVRHLFEIVPFDEFRDHRIAGKTDQARHGQICTEQGIDRLFGGAAIGSVEMLQYVYAARMDDFEHVVAFVLLAEIVAEPVCKKRTGSDGRFDGVGVRGCVFEFFKTDAHCLSSGAFSGLSSSPS